MVRNDGRAAQSADFSVRVAIATRSVGWTQWKCMLPSLRSADASEMGFGRPDAFGQSVR